MGKAIPKNKLIEMQVYMPNAKYLGIVKDISLIPGDTGINLIVQTRAGNPMEVDWMDVKAVGDIILLKKEMENLEPTPPNASAQTKPPAPEPVAKPSEAKEQMNCPECGKPATWIEKYDRWYCTSCKKYL